MEKTQYLVTVMRCEESGMLVGTSVDIPGLTIEADAPAGIIEAIQEVAPRLLEANLGLSPEEVSTCSVNVVCESSPARGNGQSPRPHILVDSELLPAAA